MSKTSTNTAAVPEAKGALDRFKFEVANELGVPLSDGYNGNLTSKQNGSVGGYMVKKMIEAQERQMSGQNGMSARSGIGRLRDVSPAGKTGKKIPLSRRYEQRFCFFGRIGGNDARKKSDENMGCFSILLFPLQDNRYSIFDNVIICLDKPVSCPL